MVEPSTIRAECCCGSVFEVRADSETRWAAYATWSEKHLDCEPVDA